MYVVPTENLGKLMYATKWKKKKKKMIVFYGTIGQCAVANSYYL